MMIDERARRRPTFQEGASVRLADGQNWSLPSLLSGPAEPVVSTLVRAVAVSSDEPERLRDELALTILLLSRNYDLTPDLYPQLLSFQPGDPAQTELRKTVRALALELDRSVRVELVPNIDRPARPSGRKGAAAKESLHEGRSRFSAR